MIAGGAGAQSAWPSRHDANDALLPVDQAFRLIGAERKGDALSVSWDIAPGYYLYRQRLRFEPAQAFGPALLPRGEAHHDEHFGNVEIYRGVLEARVPIHAGAVPALRVSYQGCADAGVCYPPQTRTLEVGAQP